MILRGESHILRDDVELMKKVRSPLTITILKQLQELYEVRSRRKLAEDEHYYTGTIEALVRGEFEEYCHLLDLLDDWMKPPVTIFDGKKRKLRSLRVT